MIIDLSEYRGSKTFEYDMCIIGSGPAGLSLANELRDAGVSICVLESGKRRTSKHADRLRKVEVVGALDIYNNSRERVFGGTSSAWRGLSAPLDPVDFRKRTGIPHTGWPLQYEDLIPYYDRASKDYGFPPLTMFAKNGFERLKQSGDWHISWEGLEEKVFVAPNKPQRFAKDLKHIFLGDAVDLYVDATALSLCAPESGRGVSHCQVRSRSGNLVDIRAKTFVVAAGGIENARLLLNSKDICPAGLGNEYDQVGRYFMNHLKGFNGAIRLNRTVRDNPYYYGCVIRSSISRPDPSR